MKSKLISTTAASAIALATLTPHSALGQTSEPVIELPTAIDMDVDAWSVDRADVASFENVDWQGREDVVGLMISPPASPTSFYNWQGYSQLLDTPAGSASIKGDIWIGSDWATGTDTDYVRTGYWGSVLPEGSTSYIDAQAIFPIISFTNEDGDARLQVWDTTANPSTGWSDLTASESALNLDAWNSFEMRVLLEADRIDYVVNGVPIFSWDMPRGRDGNISDELWAIYLNGRNNGVTSFDTYWSELATAELVSVGGTLSSAPDGFNILANAVGGVSIADSTSVGGSIHSGSGSIVTLSFGEDSGVATTSDGEIGVVSDEDGSVTLSGGAVSTSGSNAPGLYATGTGSEIATDGTAVTATGAGSFGAYAINGGAISLEGGSVSSNRAALVADGGNIETTGVALSTTVASDNGNDVGVVTTLDGGSADLLGGSITLSGGRMAGLLALSEGEIIAEDISITASGDRARGVYANADDNGGGSATVSGISIETDGLLSHGLFAKRQSGTTADTMASITASDIEISVDGTSANGVYADVGSSITINDSSVTTAGDFGVGLHAQALDDGLAGDSVLTATDVAVSTSGTSAIGAFADRGGQIVLMGGSVTTSGSAAHGLLAAGTADYLPQITATDVTVLVTADDAVGLGIAGTGSIEFTGGSVASGDAAIGVSAYPGGTATFNVSGSTLASESDVVLDVDRDELDDGTGIVSLTLSDGTTATGNVLDTGTKTTGYTDVTLDNATLTGGVDGVRNFTMSNGASWGATGAGSIDTLALGTGGGTIDVASGANVALSGALTGEGSLTKVGEGTLTFSGDGSSYAGTAMIDDGLVLLTGTLAGHVVINEDGTFQIGNSDATGDLTGSTVNNGALIFARSDDYDYAGALSGDGSLIKQGDTTLTLSGDYSYTGSTVIQGGIIKITSQLDEDTDLVVDNGTVDLSDKEQTVSGLSGDGGTLALGTTGTLTVNQSEDTSYSGNITGGGSFAKSGSGLLNLTGNSDFSGQMSVNDGRLAVNGAMPEGNIVVNSGGTLGGTGTVKTVAAETGGTVAPGNSIGTLHVAGDVGFDSGSVYEVEVDADGNSDSIIATGVANLDGGTVSVLAELGDYARFTDYVILSAEGGVNGTFDGNDVDLPFLDGLLSYGANNVVLTLSRNDQSFADLAITSNQLAVATALDSMSATADLPRAVVGQTSDAAAQNAFEVLGGDLWASVGTLLLDRARSGGQVVLSRLQRSRGQLHGAGDGSTNTSTTAGGRTTVWGEAIADWQRLGADGNAAALRHNQTGFWAGFDTAVGDWRLGAAYGYSEVDSDAVASGSSANITSNNLAVYAGGTWDALNLKIGGSYGWHDIDGERSVAFPSFFEVAQADYSAKSASLFGELSYAIEAGSVQIEPFASANHVIVKSDGFVETEAAIAGLTVDKAERDVTYTSVGLRMGPNTRALEATALSPHISAAWEHAFGSGADFAGTHALPSGNSFQVNGLPVARNALAIDAGFDASVASGIMIGVSYSGTLARRWNDHGAKVGLSFSF